MLKSGIYFTPETDYLLENIKKKSFSNRDKKNPHSMSELNILYLSISDDSIEPRKTCIYNADWLDQSVGKGEFVSPLP